MSDAVKVPIDAQHVPGAEIAIVDSGRVLVQSGYGTPKLGTDARVTPETRFEVGSISKQFTAAAILQLQEQGKLKLTDTLAKYVPEYTTGKDVTLEEMLWNVSGIPDFLFVKGYATFWNTATKQPGSFEAVLAFIENAPLGFKPGSQYEYSNSNYALLGEVVARVSHESLETYLRTNIFPRANMTQTAFIEDEPALPGMATGYRSEGKNGLVPAPWAGHWFDGNGSIVSTALDIAKWDRAFFSGKILRMQDVRLATTPHILPSGESTGEGFGWWSSTFGGQQRYAFTGKTWGFTAMNVYFPKMHEAIVVLTNDSNEQVWTIANAALAAVHPAIMQAYLAPAPGEDPAVTALVKQWVQRLQTGNIDASQLSPQLPAPELSDNEAVLRKCGRLTAAIFRKEAASGTGTAYVYMLQFPGTSLNMAMNIGRDKKISDISLLLNDGRN